MVSVITNISAVSRLRSGIEPPDSETPFYVKDFGVYQKDIIELGPENFNLFILSGSPWDLAQTISTGLELSRLGNTALSVITITSPLQKNLQENSAVKYTAFLLTGMHLPVPKPKQIYSFMYYLSKGEKRNF